MQTKRLTMSQAILNVRQFCSHQERSHIEVKERLFSFGLNSEAVDGIVMDLISGDFLNEERYARAFARGKFKLKGWGKVKIRYELKKKRVSEFCIRKGMGEIDDVEYTAKLSKLFEEKAKLLKGEKNKLIRNRKLINYLLQKGYERDLILDNLKNGS
jgi:regulatory protein